VSAIYNDSVKGLGPCVTCGHDPACGWSQVGDDWLCHTDDHSCYVTSAGMLMPGLPCTHAWVQTSYATGTSYTTMLPPLVLCSLCGAIVDTSRGPEGDRA